MRGGGFLRTKKKVAAVNEGGWGWRLRV